MHFFGGINFGVGWGGVGWDEVGRGSIKNAIVTFETCQVFVVFLLV
jgi:hypothetical protein